MSMIRARDMPTWGSSGMTQRASRSDSRLTKGPFWTWRTSPSFPGSGPESSTLAPSGWRSWPVWGQPDHWPCSDRVTKLMLILLARILYFQIQPCRVFELILKECPWLSERTGRSHATSKTIPPQTRSIRQAISSSGSGREKILMSMFELVSIYALCWPFRVALFF